MLSLINRDLTQSKLHSLSIKKMFGLPVIVEISYNRLIIKLKNVRIDFECEMKVVFNESIACGNVGNNNPFTQDDLNKVKLMIDDLKFDRLTGRFFIGETDGPNVIHLKEQEEFYAEWKKTNTNIEFCEKMSECSVCFDNTMCKSKCGHFLCYECWSKVKDFHCDDCAPDESDDECDDMKCGNQLCPSCRSILYVSCD